MKKWAIGLGAGLVAVLVVCAMAAHVFFAQSWEEVASNMLLNLAAEVAGTTVTVVGAWWIASYRAAMPVLRLIKALRRDGRIDGHTARAAVIATVHFVPKVALEKMRAQPISPSVGLTICGICNLSVGTEDGGQSCPHCRLPGCAWIGLDDESVST